MVRIVGKHTPQVVWSRTGVRLWSWTDRRWHIENHAMQSDLRHTEYTSRRPTRSLRVPRYQQDTAHTAVTYDQRTRLLDMEYTCNTHTHTCHRVRYPRDK